MKSIVIFASGAGTNAQTIINHFKNHPSIKVAAIFCNNTKAAVIEIAELEKIPFSVFSRNDFYNNNIVSNALSKINPTLIVLAGFLWMIPENMLKQFPNQIINIHPSLLPKFGGAGMYGMKVHEAVIEAKEKFSGMTIHRVNENFDEGRILFQEKIELAKNETPQSLSQKVRELELKNYSPVIESLLI